MRGPLLLLLAAVWFYAPDLAQFVGGNTSAITYQANGLYGAVGAAVAADALIRPQRPAYFDAAVLLLSAVLWALQYACDMMWTPDGSSAAICDDVTGRPITLVCAAALLLVAAVLDKLRDHA